MGTVLYSQGVFINRCFDELNLSSPAMVDRNSHASMSRPARRFWKPIPSAPTAPRLAAFGFAEKTRSD